MTPNLFYHFWKYIVFKQQKTCLRTTKTNTVYFSHKNLYSSHAVKAATQRCQGGPGSYVDAPPSVTGGFVLKFKYSGEPSTSCPHLRDVKKKRGPKEAIGQAI